MSNISDAFRGMLSAEHLEQLTDAMDLVNDPESAVNVLVDNNDVANAFQELGAAGAVNLTTGITLISVDGTAAYTLAAGTYAGGWRIIRTLGQRIAKIDPPQGFAAQTACASILWTTAHFGFPVSTTHTISGSVMGAGATKRLVLGWRGARWHTPAEVSAAALALALGAGHEATLGAVRPWAARPA